MPDLLGYEPPKAQFIDIGNQRESVAAEKARMCKELNELLKRAPRSLGAAAIQRVMEFKAAHKSALKVLQSKTSSRQELSSALNTMRGWFE